MKQALQISGGKDSIAMLYYLKEQGVIDAAPTLAYYVIADPFYHQYEYVTHLCAQFDLPLVIVESPTKLSEYHEKFGLPVDVVPVDSTHIMQGLQANPTTLLVPYTACCAANLWHPLALRMQQDRVTDIYRGTKKSDPKGLQGEIVYDTGLTYHHPLWKWSDKKVFTFLRNRGITLPDQYAAGVSSSLDCRLCTAHLGECGAQRFRYIKAEHPTTWSALEPRLKRVKAELNRTMAVVNDALEIV